jgi:hypothetical protein
LTPIGMLNYFFSFEKSPKTTVKRFDLLFYIHWVTDSDVSLQTVCRSFLQSRQADDNILLQIMP